MKTIGLILSMVFLLGLCGCGKDKPKDTPLVIRTQEVVDLRAPDATNQGVAEDPDAVIGKARPEAETVLQDFESGNGTEKIDVFTWDYDKAQSTVQTEKAMRGTQALRTQGDKFGINLSKREFDISGYDKVFIYVYDTVGDNTIEFELRDMYGKTAKVWSNVRSAKDKWKRVAVPLEYYRGKINLKRFRNVEFYEWNKGTYYFDDFGVSKYK
jgi:hypothetical protein